MGCNWRIVLLVRRRWYEPAAFDRNAWSATATPTGPGASPRCPALPPHLGHPGNGPRDADRPGRAHAGRFSADRLLLARGLCPAARPGRPRPRTQPRPADPLDGRGTGLAPGTAGRAADGPGLLRRGLDGAPAARRTPARHGRPLLRRHDPAGAPPAGLRVGAAALRLRPRPGVGEKNGGFASKSRACDPAASCWPKTK